jgi:hypothetical protein
VLGWLGFRKAARGFRMSSPGAMGGFSRGAQGVQVNHLNPLPVILFLPRVTQLAAIQHS